MTPKAEAHVRSLDELLASPEHKIYLLIGEVEAEALQAGVVPESVKEQARCAVDWEFALIHAGNRKAG